MLNLSIILVNTCLLFLFSVSQGHAYEAKYPWDAHAAMETGRLLTLNSVLKNNIDAGLPEEGLSVIPVGFEAQAIGPVALGFSGGQASVPGLLGNKSTQSTLQQYLSVANYVNSQLSSQKLSQTTWMNGLQVLMLKQQQQFTQISSRIEGLQMRNSSILSQKTTYLNSLQYRQFNPSNLEWQQNLQNLQWKQSEMLDQQRAWMTDLQWKNSEMLDQQRNWMRDLQLKQADLFNRNTELLQDIQWKQVQMLQNYTLNMRDTMSRSQSQMTQSMQNNQEGLFKFRNIQSLQDIQREQSQMFQGQTSNLQGPMGHTQAVSLTSLQDIQFNQSRILQNSMTNQWNSTFQSQVQMSQTKFDSERTITQMRNLTGFMTQTELEGAGQAANFSNGMMFKGAGIAIEDPNFMEKWEKPYEYATEYRNDLYEGSYKSNSYNWGGVVNHGI